jgi:hypothetical protein
MKIDVLKRLETICNDFDTFHELSKNEQQTVINDLRIDIEEQQKKTQETKPVDYSEFLQEGDIQQGDDGGDYVLVSALVRIAKEHAGMIGYDTMVVQSPEKNNQWSATVVVRVRLSDKGNQYHLLHEAQVWSGAADCRLGNARDGFHRYTTALAETRALGRALRRALGIEMCTLEEVRDRSGPLTAFQKQHIKVKFIDNEMFKLNDVSKVVGREIDNLDCLTEEEASEVIETLTKKVNKKRLKGG